MYSNANLDSLTGALGLLGAWFLLAVLGLIFVHALLAGKRGRARAALVAGLSVACVYAALLLGFALASREEVLAAGTEKYFCELDCHLAYAVVGVRRARSLGVATAAGEFYVVTLRTRFDAETTAATRDGRPLTPNRRRVEVTDEWGRSFGPSALGQCALAQAGGGGLPLDTPLQPGQSYTTELVFDLPSDARRPVLLVSERMPLTRLVIGHENRPLHRRTRFRLEP